MSRELFWLTLTVVFTGLLWIPYILDRINVRGVWATLDNPKPNDKPQSPWAMRLYFAHSNTVENLVVFAPLVLVLDSLNISTQTTVLACDVFFWARVAYAIVYTIGVPVLRTLAFTVGFICQVLLVLAIFRIV
jgi:uncharacterized MAPEG superfamily protein